MTKTSPAIAVIALSLLTMAQVFFGVCYGVQPTGLGQRVATKSTVNVRSDAGSTIALGRQAMGMAGTTVDGPVRAIFGGTRHTWFNVNFDSGVDGWVADIGLDQVATPSVSNVSPNPVTGANSRQTFIVNGSSFQPGAYVRLKDLSNGGTFDKTPTSFSVTRLVIGANFTTAQATWSVQVFNPGNVGSNVRKFLVDAPSDTP